MADPGTILQISTEGIGICVKVYGILKKYASALKNYRRDLLALSKRIDRMRNVFGLLRALLLEAFKSKQNMTQLEVDLDDCKQTMQELLKLADNIENKKNHIFMGFAWGRQMGYANELTQKLSDQEDEIIHIVTILGTTFSLQTRHDIEAFRHDADSLPQLQPAFENLAIVDGSLQAQKETSGEYRPLRTWLGHVLYTGFADHYPDDYVHWRHELSEAAFWGRWDELFPAIETGEARYKESWANAIRMKPREGADTMSFWTPLHQAVFNRAPVEVIRRLVSRGAFRTARTQWTEYSFRDMTPLDLAHELGHSYLFKDLEPIIKHPLPLDTLPILQNRFHDIIRRDLGEKVQVDRLYLPMLEALTEIGSEDFWFSIRYWSSPAGYIFRLDGRDLIVKSFNIGGEGKSQIYQISKTETREMDEIMVINDGA